MPLSLNRQSPEVALVPDSGASMDIDTCVAARILDDSEHTLEITTASGNCFTSRFDRGAKTYAIDPSSTLPDLAVIQVAEGDDRDLSLRLRARLFLARHLIPTLIIASSSQWEIPTRPLHLDVKSPHFVVHVPGSTMSESAVLKRLPVDIDTFLSINSLQLNRSIACMLENASLISKEMGVACTPSRASKKATFGLFTFKQVLLLGLFFASLITLQVSFDWMNSLAALKSTDFRAHTSSVTKADSSQTFTLLPSTTILPSAAVTLPSAATKSQWPQQENSLTHVPEPEHFEVETLGDNVILVKTPRWVLESGRTPRLDFSVRSWDYKQKLEIEVSQISNTRIFTLNLPWESAVGRLHIHIKGRVGRVEVNENSTIQFSSSSAFWKKWYGYMATTEQSAEKSLPAEKEPEKAPTEPKDRLAQDVQAIASGLRTFGGQILERVKEKLARSTEERMQIRQQKRKEREEDIKAILNGIHDRAHQAVDSISQELQRAVHIVDEFKRTHFREQQKDLLKLWWRVSGKPVEQRDTTANRPHGKPRRAEVIR